MAPRRAPRCHAIISHRNARLCRFLSGSYIRAGNSPHFQHGQSVFFSADRKMLIKIDVDFAIEHVHIPPPNPHKYHKRFEARWTPLSTWCSRRGALRSRSELCIVVVIGRTGEPRRQTFPLSERLSELYSHNQLERFNRLNDLPHWIYADLLFELTK